MLDNARRSSRFLEKLWPLQSVHSTEEQKDRVGLAYISKILALGDKVARRFHEEYPDAIHKVNARQITLSGKDKVDYAGFWKEVSDIFPGEYAQEDLEFLAQEGRLNAVWAFCFSLDQPLLAMRSLGLQDCQIHKSSLLERLSHIRR